MTFAFSSQRTDDGQLSRNYGTNQTRACGSKFQPENAQAIRRAPDWACRRAYRILGNVSSMTQHLDDPPESWNFREPRLTGSLMLRSTTLSYGRGWNDSLVTGRVRLTGAIHFQDQHNASGTSDVPCPNDAAAAAEVGNGGSKRREPRWCGERTATRTCRCRKAALFPDFPDSSKSVVCPLAVLSQADNRRECHTGRPSRGRFPILLKGAASYGR